MASHPATYSFRANLQPRPCRDCGHLHETKQQKTFFRVVLWQKKNLLPLFWIVLTAGVEPGKPILLIVQKLVINTPIFFNRSQFN